MADRPLPPPLLTPTATNLDDIHDVMLPPDASSKRTYMAPPELFPMDYDQCVGIPPSLWTIHPTNERAAWQCAMLSPVRKKKPPASSSSQSPRYSLLVAAAVGRPAGAINFDEPSPNSIVDRVNEVVPSPAEKKSPSSRSIVKIWHMPRSKFTRFSREDHHYKSKTKYTESQIKKDLLSKQY